METSPDETKVSSYANKLFSTEAKTDNRQATMVEDEELSGIIDAACKGEKLR